MSSAAPKALVITGDGINCEKETAAAFGRAGFDVETRHLNDLIAEKRTTAWLLDRYAVLALPGGFSFGDDLTSGKVLALKIRHGLGWDLAEFARGGGLVFGACNGFQALIKLGVFGREVSITRNRQGRFIDTWVRVAAVDERCVWLRGLTELDLPIRHGEGRVVFSPDDAGESHRLAMKADGRVCLTYSGMDPNGSTDMIAGLCDETGRIFGLMPHPEAFVRATAHPGWTADPNGALERAGAGLAIFKNAFEEAARRRESR